MTGTIETKRDWSRHWKSIARRVAKQDFFAQVERTVGGRPIPPGQIRLLADAVKTGLALGGDDILLDLCCGNGLATAALAPFCRAVTGVDYALDLIETARGHHQAGNIRYLHRAADELTAADFAEGLPGKVSMNMGLQYFTAETLRSLLRSLVPVTGRRAHLYFSDVPDAEKIFEFYDTPERQAEFERRRAAGTEAMGTWWNRLHLRELFAEAGYGIVFVEQEPRRLAAHYRFDLLAQPEA